MMKKNILKIVIGCVVIIAMVSSCDKEKEYLGEYTTTEGLAYLKILHFSPAFRQATNGRDSFNIYVNGFKVNGSFFTYGTSFPGSGIPPYIGVPAGPQSIRITVNGVFTPDSITLASLNKTLSLGSYYSFIITDSVLKSDESKQIFVKDNFALTDTGHFTLRFVHAILNDTAGKNVDIYSLRYAANIFTNIAPGTTTAFTSQLYTTLPDTLIVRRPGMLYELARLNGASFARQRPYTLVYRGLPATTTAPKGRALSTYIHQ